MSTVLEIQSRFKKSACVGLQASPCSALQTLLLKLKRAEEGVYVCACLYVSVCIGVYVWVWCIHKHIACLPMHAQRSKETTSSLSLSVLIPLRQKLAWWPPSPRHLLGLPATALGLQAHMWPHLTSDSSDIQMVSSQLSQASALIDWDTFLAHTWTFQFLPYPI